MKKVSIILFFFSLAITMHSQNLNWREMNDYDVGMILTILKNEKGYILAGTSRRGLLLTTDNGLTWQIITNGLPNLSINKLTLLADGRIFACTAGNGIYYSTDDGFSWVQFKNELSNQSLSHFLVHQSGYFYAGATNGVGGLWRSKNLGLSWERIDFSFEGKNINALVINSKGHIFTSTKPGLIYRSTDFGNTWTKILFSKPDSQITALCVTKNDDIIAGTRKDGTYIIKNNSDSMIFLNNTLQYENVTVMGITKDGEIYAGTENCLYKLDTNNNIWTIDYNYNSFSALFISNDNQKYIGSHRGQIFIRDDNHNKWIPIYYNDFQPYMPISSLIVLKTGELIAGTERDCLFFLSNQRIFWEVRCKGLKNSIIKTLYESDNGEIFSVLDTFGVFVSRDTCKNWTQFNTGLENRTVKSFQSIQNGDLLAGSDTGIYVNHRGDTVWSETSSGLTDKNINCLLMTSYNQIFAGSEQGTVFKSFNNGQTWVETGKLFKNDKPITCIVINSKGLIFAGTLGKGIYRSKDNGATWHPVNFGILDYNINSLVVTKYDDLIANTLNSTYYSSVNGDSWIRNPGENLYPFVYSKGKIYAGTNWALYVADSIIRTKNQLTGFWVNKGNYFEETIQVGAISFIRYSIDGKSLFTFGEDKIFRKWDVNTGKILEEHPYFDKERITDIDFDENRNILAVAHQKNKTGYLDLFNLKYDTLIYSINLKYDHEEIGQYGDDLGNPKVAFDLQKNRLFTSLSIDYFMMGHTGLIGRVDSWDLTNGNHIKKYEQINYSPFWLKFSPDYNNLFLSGYQFFTSSPYSGIPSKKYFKFYLINPIDTVIELNYRVYKIATSSNQKYFASSTDSTNIIYLYDYNTFEIISSWSNGYIHENYCPNSLEFSKDGKYLISSSTVSGHSKYKNKPTLDYIRIWRTETVQLIDSITFQSGLNLQLDISPDSLYIAAGGSDGLIKIIKPKVLTQKLKSYFVPDSSAKFIGSTIYFRDSSIGKPISWYWDFGDGSTSTEQNPSHKYIDTGNYDITFITSDGFNTDTLIKKQYIHISPMLIADFDANPTTGVYPLKVQFINQSIGDAKYFDWFFGMSSSTDVNPEITYTGYGNYITSLTVSDGYFSNTKSKEISVLREPYKYPVIFEKDYFNRIYLDEGNQAIECINGDYIVSGTCKNRISYPDEIYDHYSAIYRFDVNGNYIWSKTLSHGEKITQLSDNNFILIDSPTYPYGNYYLMTKISQDGELIWIKQIGNSDSLTAFKITPLNNEFLIIGKYLVGDNNTFISKFDNDGNNLWTKYFPGYGGKILGPYNDGYLITNILRYNINLNIIKTDSNFNIESINSLSDKDYLFAYDFTRARNGNIIAVGEEINYINGIILMVDSNCKIIWEHKINTEGYDYYSVIMLNDTVFAATGNLSYLPGFTVFNDSGKILNEVRFMGRNAYFKNINLTKNNEIILTGMIIGSDNHENIYFVKTMPFDLLLGINDYTYKKDGLSLSVFPNPMNGQFTVNYYLNNDSHIRLKLFNTYGAEVEELFNELQGAGNHSIVCQNDLLDLSSGIYYLQLLANGNTITTKIVIAR